MWVEPFDGEDRQSEQLRHASHEEAANGHNFETLGPNPEEFDGEVPDSLVSQ